MDQFGNLLIKLRKENMPKNKYDAEGVQLILKGDGCKTTCKVLSILAKFCEIVLIIGAICCGICGIALGVGSRDININDAITAIKEEEGFPAAVLEIPEVSNFLALEPSRQLAAVLGAIAIATILLVLTSILARYVYRFFKNLSHGRTPFTMENVDVLQKIGVWTFILAGVSVVASIIIELLAGAKSVSINVSVSTIAMGFVALVLAVVFKRGVELENKLKK
jgi:hypothetical protein